jgi:LPXTG-motif cell wall-anchored protein
VPGGTGTRTGTGTGLPQTGGSHVWIGLLGGLALVLLGAGLVVAARREES